MVEDNKKVGVLNLITSTLLKWCTWFTLAQCFDHVQSTLS